jgi:hypothetical protein
MTVDSMEFAIIRSKESPFDKKRRDILQVRSAAIDKWLLLKGFCRAGMFNARNLQRRALGSSIRILAYILSGGFNW